MLLKKLSGFSQFIKINSVDDQSINKAANNLEIVFVKKNDYLFHQGDESNHFYGILSGKISMRKTITITKSEQQKLTMKPDKIKLNKKIVSLKKHYNLSQSPIKIKENLSNNSDNESITTDTYEEELFTRGEGYCFGEWGLIYKCPRATSVYALEDTYFFSLDEESFKNSFMKCLNKAESERRDFLIDNLFPFKTIKYNIINELYKSTIPIQCTNNQIIYEEGARANTIYIVYIEQFCLYKKYLTENQMKTQTFKILAIEKGGVVGLEAIFEQNKVYKYSLKANCGGGIGMIFSINLDKIPGIVINKMKRYFKEYYDTFERTARTFFEKKIKLEKNTINKIQFEVLNENEKCQKAINNYFEIQNEIEKKRKKINKNDVHKAKIIRPFSLNKNNFYFTCKEKVKRFLCTNSSFFEENFQTGQPKRHKRFSSLQNKSSQRNKLNLLGSPSSNSTLKTLSKNEQNYKAYLVKSSSTLQSCFPGIKFSNESINHFTNESVGTLKKTIHKNASYEKDLRINSPNQTTYGQYCQRVCIKYNTGRFNIPLVTKII